jgi:hypothetical protein
MAHPLDGATLKVGRAQEHLDSLKSEIRMFVHENPAHFKSDEDGDFWSLTPEFHFSPRSDSAQEGEHPALGPVPLARCHILGFASLRIGFAAAPNFRPGTSSAVMVPSFFSSRTSSLTCFGNHHSGLTAS